MSNIGAIEKLREAAGLDRLNNTYCVKCKRRFTQDVNVFTAAGWRETHISGVCEACFDEIFGEDK